MLPILMFLRMTVVLPSDFFRIFSGSSISCVGFESVSFHWSGVKWFFSESDRAISATQPLFSFILSVLRAANGPVSVFLSNAAMAGF